MNRFRFLIIIVCTFIAVIAWVIADIIFNTKSSLPPNPNLPSLLEEANPDFNREALDQISKKGDIPALISLPGSEETKTPVESTGSGNQTASRSATPR